MGRILIDGFPRSGNTFFHELLSNSFLDIEIPQFRHSVKTFTPETYVLVRNPGYSIPSFMTMFKHEDAKSAEDWWVRYYSNAIESSVRFVLFDDLVNNPEKILDSISKDTGFSYSIPNITNLNKNQSLSSYDPSTNFYRANSVYFEVLKVIDNL